MRMCRMQLSQVSFESHLFGATIYVAGWLGDNAALRTEELVRGLPAQILALRLDIRGVDLIDPGAFVRVARTLGAGAMREGAESPCSFRRAPPAHAHVPGSSITRARRESPSTRR